MTYNDFLQFIFSPITNFVNWLHSVSNSLLNNYFFITILGCSLFVSLVWFFFDFILDLIYKRIKKYDDFNNLYEDYKLRQEVKYQYLDNHYDKVYDYNYKIRVMNEQVYNGVSLINKALLVDNKLHSLRINQLAFESFKDENIKLSSDEKIFKGWRDKKTGIPLTKEEQEEIDYLLEHF